MRFIKLFDSYDNSNYSYKIGQKVIALSDGKNDESTQSRIKGEIYIIKDIVFCSKCGKRFLNFGETQDFADWGTCNCGGKTFAHGLKWTSHHHYAPLDDLESLLGVAVSEEDYEFAAIIRDMIGSELVKESLLGREYLKRKYHQNLLDYAYKWWLKPENKDKRYYEMVNFIKEDLGDEAMLLILMGSYNYQVGNGGHMQYMSNRYSSSTGKDGDLGLMNLLMDLIETYFNYPSKDKLLDIIQAAYDELLDYVNYTNDHCFNCGGSGEVSTGYFGGEEEDYVSCDDCGGSGEIDESEFIINSLHKIDLRYYEIEKQVMREMNDFAKIVTDKLLGKY